jgi:hypothetical protein
LAITNSDGGGKHNFGGLAAREAMRPTGVVLYAHKVLSSLGLANKPDVFLLYQAVLVANILAPKGDGFMRTFLEGAREGTKEGLKGLVEDFLKDWSKEHNLVPMIEAELAQEFGQAAAHDIIGLVLEWAPILSARTKVKRDLNTVASVLAGKALEIHCALFVELAIIHELYVTPLSGRLSHLTNISQASGLYGAISDQSKDCSYVSHTPQPANACVSTDSTASGSAFISTA